MNIGEYTKTQNNLGNTETELIVSQQDEHADTLAITEERVTVETNNPWRPQDADREYIKQNIRRRVRNASVTGSAVFIRAKPKPTIQDDENKSVAVYARVSTKSTEQVIRILGAPPHVCLRVTEDNSSIALAPCEAKDVMSFKVPDTLFADRHCIFRICSKQFVRNIMAINGMNPLQSYSFDGIYSEKQNAIMFMLNNTGMEE